jgi:hypothetical protein
MHEYDLVRALLERVERAASAHDAAATGDRTSRQRRFAWEHRAFRCPC